MPGRRRRREPADFLDELMTEFTREDPRFPELVRAAEQRQRLLRALAGVREKAGVSQTDIASVMQTSQSAIARLEGGGDAKLSTIDRFATAVGKRVEWRIRSAPRRRHPRRKGAERRR